MRKKGTYTVPDKTRYPEELRGKTFASYGKFETARAHAEGWRSELSRRELQGNASYQNLKRIAKRNNANMAEVTQAYELQWYAKTPREKRIAAIALVLSLNPKLPEAQQEYYARAISRLEISEEESEEEEPEEEEEAEEEEE